MLNDLVSDNIPALASSDTGAKALQIMDDFRVSHLPVVSDTEYIGLVSDNDIYGISDDVFDENGYIEIEDTYDSRYLTYLVKDGSNKTIDLLEFKDKISYFVTSPHKAYA